VSEPIDPTDGAIVELPRPPMTLTRTHQPFKLMSLDAVLDQRPPPWLVKRVLRRGELAVLFADPSVGKTFAAIDLGLKVALGLPWWGYGVKQGLVIYLAAEGVGGLRYRVKAWALENNAEVHGCPFFVLPHAVILGDDDQFERFLAAIKGLTEGPALIVIDTLARCMAGSDENSAEEMGTLIDRCAQLQALGSAVLVIHHKNKAGTGERGSTALRGAADVMWEAARLEDGSIKLVGSKAKDTALLSPIYLRTKPYTLGVDEDGEFETSLALQLGERPNQPVAATPTARSGADAGKEDLGEVDFEEQGHLIREAMQTLYNGGPIGGATLQAASGVKRTTFYDVLKIEIAAGRIAKDSEKRNPRYLLTEHAPEFVSPPTDPAAVSSPSPSPGPVLRKLANSDSDSSSDASSGLREAGSGILHPDQAESGATTSASIESAASSESESESRAIPKGLAADSDSRSTPQPDPVPKAKRTRGEKAASPAAIPASTLVSVPPPDPPPPGDERASDSEVTRG